MIILFGIFILIMAMAIDLGYEKMFRKTVKNTLSWKFNCADIRKMNERSKYD